MTTGKFWDHGIDVMDKAGKKKLAKIVRRPGFYRDSIFLDLEAKDLDEDGRLMMAVTMLVMAGKYLVVNKVVRYTKPKAKAKAKAK